MKHKIAPLIVIILIATIAGGGYWYLNQHPDLLTQLKLRLGLISEAEATGVYQVSGYIEADEVDIAAEAKGRISRLTVEEGDYVEAGQVLIELDTALLEAEMRQAQARITTAKAHLAKVEAGIRAEEIAKAEAAVTVAAAEAMAAYTRWQDAILLRDNPQELDMQIDAARTALQLAELKIAYAAPLKDAGEEMWELGRQQWEEIQEGIDINVQGKSIHINFPEGRKQDAGVAWNQAGADRWEAWVNLNSAVVERDDAEAGLNDLLRLRNDPQQAQLQVVQAEAVYQTAQAEVEVAGAQLEILKAGPRAEHITLAQAQVEQAEANLAALKVERDQHVLTASRAGWVVEQMAHEGEMATPGAPLLTLADLSQVTLTVYVPEPDVDLVQVRQAVRVLVDSFPGESFSGHISYISAEAEFTPKNVQTKAERVNTVFAVKITLDNEDQRLKPGMPADAILAEGTGL